MKPALLAVTILLCLSACDRGLKVGPAAETRLPTDSAMMWMPGNNMRMEGERRLLTVDLAVKGKRGERFGLAKAAE